MRLLVFGGEVAARCRASAPVASGKQRGVVRLRVRIERKLERSSAGGVLVERFRCVPSGSISTRVEDTGTRS